MILVCSCLTSYAQVIEAENEAQDKIVIKADRVISTLIDNVSIDTLLGNVELIQDSLVITTRKAILFDKRTARAYGDVIIIQKDSVLIYCDTLLYDGDTKDAYLSREVILIDGQDELHAYGLDYNTETEIGVYHNGAIMFSEGTQLQSNKGVYDGKRKTTIFKENVRYQDSSQVVLADSMLYYMDDEVIRFLSPANIIRDSTRMYSRQGIFSKKDNKLILAEDVQIMEEERLIRAGLAELDGESKIYYLYYDPVITESDGTVTKADTIIYYEQSRDMILSGRAFYQNADGAVIEAPFLTYNDSTGRYITTGSSKLVEEGRTITSSSFEKTEAGSKASGGVVIVDTTNQLTAWTYISERIDSINRSILYREDGDKSLMALRVEEDSLYILADTLITQDYGEGDSTYSTLRAIHGVKLSKGNILGRSDFMDFSSLDSIMWLYGDPVIWSDSTQLSGDTIGIYFVNQQIEKLILVNSAFIVIPDTMDYYNQIKGTKIVNLIDDGSISQSEVTGNAEVFYIVKNEEQIEGVSLTKSLSMTIYLEDGRMDRLNQYGSPENSFENYNELVNYKSQYLRGFRWRLEERPTIESILIFRK